MAIKLKYIIEDGEANYDDIHVGNEGDELITLSQGDNIITLTPEAWSDLEKIILQIKASKPDGGGYLDRFR